ncbi:DUF4254 domain-containing protein [Nocardia brasiliensis]|uniref:DUF4254 domain-containing protein n=1 Tax=Nocardia brasiliensis TaxID=37326 RepID=UPI0024561CF4|nr:DUF4254 domain-containing protein [Nocardia brasiliensis]
METAVTITTSPEVVDARVPRNRVAAETTSDQHSLPDWHQLLAAFRGEIGRSPGDNLVTRWASDFASLHRVRHLNPNRTAEIDCRREQLVILVNSWTETHVTTTSHGASATRSFGAAADVLAAAYVAAEYCLMAAEDASAAPVHAAWERAAELACRWNDLVAENPGRWHPSGVADQDRR